MKLFYKGILKKIEFGRLLSLLLEGDNRKTIGDFPGKQQSLFMGMNRVTNFDWNTSLCFSLSSSDEIDKVFTQ